MFGTPTGVEGRFLWTEILKNMCTTCVEESKSNLKLKKKR